MDQRVHSSLHVVFFKPFTLAPIRRAKGQLRVNWQASTVEGEWVREEVDRRYWQLPPGERPTAAELSKAISQAYALR